PERHPADMRHHQGTRDEVHNVYNHLWAQLLFRHWREERPNQRVYNLTRSAFAGTQRYNPTLWSGDVARTFEAFRPQIPFLLNMGLAGFSLYGSDLGGFTGEGPSPELYTRWMQHGALSPTMRPHGSDAPTEPWRFGAQAETITRDMVRLRYRLMPYLYTLAWESHRTGMPMVRPLFFDDPSDDRLHEVEDSYLLGEALLVAPVLRDSARTRTVRLPEGTWVNYWTDEAMEGGRTVTVDAPLDQIPLFVRGGALVPMRPVAPHVDAQPADTLTVAVYPDSGRQASVSLYEDDGSTRAYQEGAYAQTELTQQLHARPDGTADLSVAVGESVGRYEGQPRERTVRLRVHRVAQRPEHVTRNGEALARRDWQYDDAEDRLTVQARGPVDQSHRIVMKGIGQAAQF
ncbi:MAG: TIM-barrel domain-containing protein, partial [Salinivenus sp.]